MKKCLVIIGAVLALNFSHAQQISLSTQYMFNEIYFNPGVVGTKDHVVVHGNFRKQWAGLDGAPTTQHLTSHAYVGYNMGLGGAIYNDVSGPSRRTGGMIAGSYRLPLTKDEKHLLNFGVGVSFSQHVIDTENLTTFLPNDAALTNGVNNQLIPDFNIGVFYRFADKGIAGLSVRNILQTDRDLLNFDQSVVNPLERNYYLYGGYDFSVSENFDVKPLLMVRMIDALAMQFDFTTITTYKKRAWLGVSYRYKDAVAVMAGAKFAGFRFGYSYDITTSQIRFYSSGTHELFFELQLPNGKAPSKKSPYLKRNRMYSPTN